MLKTWRAKAKMTQDQLAKKLEVDTQFISNIERNVAALPPKHFKKTAKILNVPMGTLIKNHLKWEEKKIRTMTGYKNPISQVR